MSHFKYHGSSEGTQDRPPQPVIPAPERNAGSQLAPATSRVLGVSGMPYNGGVWQVNATAVFKDWFDQGLNHAQRQAVRVVVDLLAERGPRLGRPYADRVHGSKYHNMKELRPRGSAAHNIRVLFIFDPERQALLLLGGDKTGRWSVWYRRAIPEAEQLYEEYLDDLDTGRADEVAWGKEMEP